MKIHNLDPQKEREFEKLREDGLRLHVPITEQLWKLEVFDKDGQPLETMHKRAESWVRSAYNMLFSIMATKGATGAGYGAGSLQMRQTSGTVNASTTATNDHVSSALTDAIGTMGFRADAGDTTFGILVGSSAVAESFEHHSIQTLIANGTGAGQLSYIATDATVMTYVAGTRILSVDWRRFFNNNSGGDVTVRELAAVRRYILSGQVVNSYLLSRDLLPTAITIPNAGQLRVTYTFRITYPA